MIRHIILLSLITFVSTSCASNTGTGVLVGGILGSGIGGIATGGAGALIGGTVGIISGGLIGVGLDDRDKRMVEKSSPRTIDRINRQEPLTISDVIKLSQSGVADNTIIEYIDSTDSTYNLSKTQIRRLREAGVSPQIIDFMMNTAR